ncbi:hypothetical protein BGZ83_000774 [Gryganskiella cystojenkinii]|nr:hypothetical protein BGZ83_000774 [Gryganskiella cystojenkinii]
MDKIQRLELNHEKDMFIHLEKAVPVGAAAVLNQCRYLRDITITENSRKSQSVIMRHPSPSPRLDWFRLTDFDFVPFEDDNNSGTSSIASRIGLDRRSRRAPNNNHLQQPQSFLDFLPLEGSLLNRLESLTIKTGTHTPQSLDPFMNRLRASGAAKTLKSLAILGSTKHWRSMAWWTLRDGICDLSALETLKIERIMIPYAKYTPESYVMMSDDEGDDEFSNMDWWDHPGVSAPSLKSLTINCRPDLDVKWGILTLFPNLEHLSMEFKSELWERAIDQRIFSEANIINSIISDAAAAAIAKGSSNDGKDNNGNTGNSYHDVDNKTSAQPSSLFIPFPHLKSLDTSISIADDWTVSQLLQTWAERQPEFQLTSLELRATYDSFLRPAQEKLFEVLCEQGLTVKRMTISDQDLCWSSQILTSSLCQGLEELELQDPQLDLAMILISALQPRIVGDQWELSQQDLFSRLPWSRTVRKFSIQSSLDSTLNKTHGEGALTFVQSILKRMPQLVELELSGPILDLALFEGLGREMPLTGSPSKATTEHGTDATSSELKNSCLTELPMLERLSVCRSKQSKSRDQISAWSQQLQHQFRFLEDLQVKKQ